jgi:hypothetical protein
MQPIVTLMIGSLRWIGLTVIEWVDMAVADEGPISGTIKIIDQRAQTMTLQTTSKGNTREVTIDIKPASRIVRFTRAAEPGKSGFVEQTAALGGLKPGWTVNVTTKHEGGREVADLVKVMLER